MRTEDLIQSLSAQTRAVPRNAVEQRLAIGLIAGGALTLALVLSTLGLRADLPGAMTNARFLMKAAYTIALGVVAILAVRHVARPDATGTGGGWMIALPVLLLAGLSAIELAGTPSDYWMPMWLGSSWRQCSMRVGVLSLPVFAGLLWSFRQLAPTNLRVAGAAAGLAAGAVGATLYGLHCPEVSATFVLTWYTLGIAIPTAIGAIFGPRLLRW